MIAAVPASVQGEANPTQPGKDENGLASMQSKDEVVKFLIEVFPSIMAWHSSDHYGQMVVYARMNGIVPPASRR